MDRQIFSLRKNGAEAAQEVALVNVMAAAITSSEQDIVLLDEEGTVVAIVQLQPGIDRTQL